MKTKRVLSAAMAGVMTVSSALVMQLPAAAEETTVISNLSVNGWNAFPVNLREFGIMTDDTTVTITCVTPKTDIVYDDGESPDWAFGVIINDNWDHETAPHCNYDSSKTIFTMTLTAEELDYNPEFMIQSQQPESAIFTVTASGLKEDTRDSLTLPAISSDVTMFAFEDSSWLNGSICANTYTLPDSEIEDVTYNVTTVGELREKYRTFVTPANPFYCDSLGEGSQAYCYSIEIATRDADGAEWTPTSNNSIDFESEGITFVDSVLTELSFDDEIITEIRLNVSAKTDWNSELNKSQAVSEKIRNLPINVPVVIEIDDKSGADITLEPITDSSIGMDTCTWDDGTVFTSGNIPMDPGELKGITFAEFMEKYHSISVSAPGYFSDTLGAGEDAFVYNLNIGFSNEDSSDGIWLDRDARIMTEDSTLFTCVYEDLLSGAEDYVLSDFGINVSSKMEWTGTENQAKSEILRNLKPGDTFVVELVEDTREAIEVNVTDKAVTLNTWEDSNWLEGITATGGTSILEVPGITYGETTFDELRESTKSISATVPYFTDSIGAGKEAFEYKFVFRFADDKEYYCDSAADMGETLTQFLDEINLEDAGIESNVITGVFVNVEAKREDVDNDKQRTVSEVIRNQPLDSDFLVEFVEDTRKDVKVEITDRAVGMFVRTDSEWFESVVADGAVFIPEVPGITYGETTFEKLLETAKSISTTLPYFDDSIGAGRDAFLYNFRFIFEDGKEACCNTLAVPGDSLTQRLDEINLEEQGIESTVITGVYIDIGTKLVDTENGKQIAESEVIRQQPTDSSFIIELVEDTREAVDVKVTDKSVTLTAWEDPNSDWLEGVTAGGSTSALTIPGITYGKTTFEELSDTIKSISATIPYSSDTVNAGKDAFMYKFVFRFDDERELHGEYTEIGKPLTQYIDAFNLKEQGIESTVISEIYINVEAKREDGENGKQITTSEIISSLEADETLDVMFIPAAPKTTAKADVDKVKLTWNAIPGAVKYRVQYRITGTKTWTNKYTTDTTYTVDELTGGNKYDFLVFAYDGVNWSKWTSADIVTATPIIASPSFLVKGVFGGRNVTFNCSTPGAKIYYSSKTSKLTTADQCVEPGETVLFTSFYGTIYAKAYCNGKWSNVAKLVLKIPTVNTPTITKLSGGKYKIKTTTPSSIVYYTIDGTTPSATNYKGKFWTSHDVSIPAGKTIKAIAVRNCFTDSKVATAKS